MQHIHARMLLERVGNINERDKSEGEAPICIQLLLFMRRMSDRTSIDKSDSAKIDTLKHTLNKTYMTNNIQRHNLQS